LSLEDQAEVNLLLNVDAKFVDFKALQKMIDN